VPRPLRVLLSLALAGGLLALVILGSGLSWEDLRAAFGTLGWRMWMASLGVQGTLYALRALRLRALLGSEDGGPSLGSLVAVSATHTTLAYFLPARLGEAALPLLLSRGAGARASAGTAALLLVRLLDLACLALLMAAACLVLGSGPQAERLPWLTSAGLALLVPAALFTALLLCSGAAVRLGAALLRLTGLGRTVPGARALAFLPRVAADASAVGPRRLLLGAFWSAPLWFGVFAFWGLVSVATGLEGLSWAEATFGASLTVLSTLLPLNLFAGVGFQDAGFAFGFGLLGVPKEAAAASALATHAIYAGNLALFGLAGQAWLSRTRASGAAR
jgi:uncharacterized membrane protein YbhN (UPF0104 family)